MSLFRRTVLWMPERRRHTFRPTLTSALLASERGEIGPWLQALLRDAERPNFGLADGLLLVKGRAGATVEVRVLTPGSATTF